MAATRGGLLLVSASLIKWLIRTVGAITRTVKPISQDRGPAGGADQRWPAHSRQRPGYATAVDFPLSSANCRVEYLTRALTLVQRVSQFSPFECYSLFR